jgi:tRNA (adenine57-N1/adenine58-N1)-methyltransferase catalytic subunit
MTTTIQTDNLIKEGDYVLICFQDDVTYLVQIDSKRKHPIHRGRPIELDALIGVGYGSWLDCGSARALLLQPTVDDFMMKVHRESGIVYPKDAAIIMMKLGIRSGSRVIEIGTGSGSLTTALASQVAPSGSVFTYDRRLDFIKMAQGNLKKANLLNIVELKERSDHELFGETEVDAIVSDVPEPWHEVEAIQQSLKDGGRIATLNPTYNQIEQTADVFCKAGFVMIESMEVLVRGILARAGKTRPEQRMVGHTEFILFAVKPKLLNQLKED